MRSTSKSSNGTGLTGASRERCRFFFRTTNVRWFLKHEFVDSPGFARTFDDPLWSQTYRSTGDATGLLPPIAYIGDSFAGGIQVSGLHAHFRATYMTRWGVRPKLSDFIEALPADTGVLLLQSTEMGIGAVLRSDEADIDRAIAIIRARRR